MKNFIVHVHRREQDAYEAFREETMEHSQLGHKYFRMYATHLQYEIPAAKVRHISLDKIRMNDVPEEEHVRIKFECLVTEEERMMFSRRWIVV